MNEKKIKQLKSLTVKKLRINAIDIKAQIPKEIRYVITYSKNFTLSLSNYCINQCGYCFYNYKIPKSRGKGNVILLSKDQIVNLIQKALQYNCKEALIMSGECPESFLEVKKELEKRKCKDFVEFVKSIGTHLLESNILPHANLGYLTYNEIKDLKKYNASMGLMIESSCKSLTNPGGVHENSPSKSPENRIKHIVNAGKLMIPFTTGLLLGIGEKFQARVNDLLLIKELHQKYGHIQAVIIQNFTEKPGIQYRPKNLIPIEETLKTAGIAKLILGNEIVIQVPPNLIQNYEKEALEMGVDDFGGVSPFTFDYINPNHIFDGVL